MASGVSFILHCVMEKVLIEQQLECKRLNLGQIYCLRF